METRIARVSSVVSSCKVNIERQHRRGLERGQVFESGKADFGESIRFENF